ncbi:MAG: response regulator transcription factor [Eggerthellaceae bacterium]|nr:response regulator transcription factor [Eggerthellaceae bacterium]
MRALVVEDDRQLSEILAHVLRRDGFSVDAVPSGLTGAEFAESGLYDVIILDVMLPEMSGLDAAKRMRERGVRTPILMLTALGQVPDKIGGLDAGADAYMTKPFSPRELMARVRALVRRMPEERSEVLRAGDLSLDTGAYTLMCGSESVQLADQEMAVARLFLANADRTLTRAQLANEAWGPEARVEDNTLDAYVSMLRKKLRFLGSECQLVAVRGVGFKLEP